MSEKTETGTDSSTRTWLLNCRNCGWWDTVEADTYMNVDYQRECHEESMRNALAVGPYCPKGAVAIVSLRESAEIPQ